jgi:GntR family transcriptional regulator
MQGGWTVNDHGKIVPGYVPKYLQLLHILRTHIVSGDILPGSRLPTEEEMISTYGLSRGTVRKAIAQLEAERLIRTEQGVGSFVLPLHPRAIPFRFTDPPYTDEKLTHEVVAQNVIEAPLDVTERLLLSPGTRVIHIVRRRILAGQVVAYTERHLPEDLCPSIVGEDLTKQSVHDLLVHNSELPLLRAEVVLEAHVLNQEEARLLRSEAGLLAVIVERLTYTAPNRPAVWYRGIFRNKYYLGVEVSEPSS